MRIICILALCAICAGCQLNAPVTQQAIDWDRALVCAQRGDLVGRDLQRDNATSPVPVTGWQIHYNRSYQRCYVLVGYFHLPKDGTDQSNASSVTSHKVLYDAVERREIASVTSDVVPEAAASTWCRQTSEEVKRETTTPGCQAVSQFVSSLMRD